ncbi:TatD family hydrolase [Thalassotalea sp. G2M2-11]|uniref:TatD family hydrolase n=1 Tax=Thalassotalea sp. G2M2-11 TaxID=2787627 RepID=UPI0019D281E9|nr:TatD family hydrolase [Thalassotalea sp. G2M2-11]
MQFTDSHCHIDFTEFDAEFDSLLGKCAQQHIHRLIIPAVSPHYWQRLLTTCQTSQPCQLLPCLGIHPWFLTELNEQHLLALSAKVADHLNEIVAIGEMGLDGVIAEQQDNWAKQITFFEYQLYLANQVKKPVIIHHRRTHNEIISLLKKTPASCGGIIHGFSGSYQQAMTYIEMGFKLGIGGTITYPRAQKTIKAVSKLPLSSLVLETDAPAMPIHGEQGKHNTPLTLLTVFDTLCHLRSEPPEQLATALENNINSFLGNTG